MNNGRVNDGYTVCYEKGPYETVCVWKKAKPASSFSSEQVGQEIAVHLLTAAVPSALHVADVKLQPTAYEQAGAQVFGKSGLSTARGAKLGVTAAKFSHRPNVMAGYGLVRAPVPAGCPAPHESLCESPVEALWRRHQTAGEQCGQSGLYAPQRQMLLGVAGVMLDLASDAHADADALFSDALTKNARTCVDLATDFIPGVSLAKDIGMLVTGTNLVTGESLTKVEMGFVVAGVLMPGALKGTVKGIGRLAQSLRRIVSRGGRSSAQAKQLLESVEASVAIAEKFGSHAEQAMLTPRVQAASSSWGTAAGSGLNQLLEHTLGKVHEPNRLLRIEQYAGAEAGSLTKLATEKTVDAAERAMLTLHNAAEQVVARGEKFHESANKVWSWLPAKGVPKVGLAVVEYEGKKQSLMVMTQPRWAKRKAGL